MSIAILVIIEAKTHLTGRQSKIGLVDENVSLADLIRGLNALGVGPRELIDILTAIKAAGALHADIVLL